MANERKTAGVNIGGASIIMVFSVLCLTIFAVLTLVSANAESTLAKKSVASVKSFYSADEAASNTLSKIYDIADKESDLQAIKAQVTSLSDTIKVEEQNGQLIITYTEKIDDGQNLTAKISTDGNAVKVLSWKVQSTAEWKPDNDFNVWQG